MPKLPKVDSLFKIGLFVDPAVCCLLAVVGDLAQLLTIGPDHRQLVAELIPAGNGFRNGEDMMDTMTDTALKAIERTMDLCPIDNLFVHEDMAGKSGPLIGPNQISQFIAPYYSRVWEAARAGGAQLFSQDSDGNMNSVLDCFKAAGVQCFYPAEPAAGMDIVQMKRKYGKELYYKGGIDKHTLRKDKEAIRRELEHKLCPEPGISPAATEKGWTLQPAAKTPKALLDMQPESRTHIQQGLGRFSA